MNRKNPQSAIRNPQSIDSTLIPKQVDACACVLARRDLPIIERFEPAADFEELATFAAQHPTPIVHADRNPVWQSGAVSGRLIEALAIAAHEPIMLDADWKSLAQIILEHAEYLYTYPSSLHPYQRIEAGAALALIGAICHQLPQSDAWRLAGFACIAEAVEALRAKPHLSDPVDAAFEMAIALDLPILGEAIDRYNAVLNRDLRWRKRASFQMTDDQFFASLNLNCPGLETVRSEYEAGHLNEARSAYTDLLVDRFQSGAPWGDESFDSWCFTPSEVQGVKRPECLIAEIATSKCHAFDLAKSCLEAARYLATHTVCHRSTLQTAQIATSGLGVAALLFPEWRDGEQLLKLALRRYKWILAAGFFPDGFHIECASNSHHLAFASLSRFYRIARFRQPHLLQEFADRFEKIVEVFMYLSQPDYHLPLLGDTDAYLSAADPCRIGHDLFGREDFRYIASEGEAGTLPTETSHAFPYAGYYVMRDQWGKDAQYLVFDGGYFGPAHRSAAGGQPHEDKLTFALYAHGRPLLLDPGICRGDEDVERYFRSSRGHNSLRIDGKGQSRRARAEEEVVPDPDTRWLTTPAFDFVEGWYKEGFAGADDADLQQKRSIFYIKDQTSTSGEYFILHDLVLGEDERRLEQIFHLAPLPEERMEVMGNGLARTLAPGAGNLVIAPVDAQDVNARLHRAAGWTGGSEKSPSPELVYTTTRSLPAVMNCVLFPLRPGVEMVPIVKPINVNTAPDVLATGFTITHGPSVDLVLISDDGFATIRTCESSLPEVVFAGEYLFARLDAQGNWKRIMMIYGQYLKIGGRVLIDLPEPQESYII